MANETQYATKGYTTIIRWVDESIDLGSYIIQRTLSVGSDVAVAGDVMSADGETIGLVDRAVTTDVGFCGILLGPNRPGDTYDLDDAITDGTTVDILRPTGGRTIVSVILDSTTTAAHDIEEFDWVRVNEAGHVELFVWANAADSTDTFEIVVGKAAEVMANSDTDDRVLSIWY